MSEAAAEYDDVLKYIAGHWPKLIQAVGAGDSDDGTLIGLPKPFMIPARREFAEMYYWDSYFIAIGLVGTEHEQLILDMVDNCAHLIGRFGFIPNASRFYFTSRSQPPFFTQLLRLGYDVKARRGDHDLKEYVDYMRQLAVREHQTAWLGHEHRHERLVHRGLSRYHDVNANDFNASCESGWDHSTRCDGLREGHDCGRWKDFLPVCLNSILYVRERDLEWAATVVGDTESALKWQQQAHDRAGTMSHLMWDDSHKFFYDYDYKAGKIDLHVSLAGFYPLWAGLATKDQASAIIRYWLPRFLYPGGLVTSLVAMPERQWAFPNGWAPLQWIVVAGLERYGYRHMAQVVRRWWCDNCAHVFRNGYGPDGTDKGYLIEKYNVANVGHEPEHGLYGTAHGFGWSNAVFVDFVKA